MFIINGLLNLPILTVTLASNHMGIEKGFSEKNITWTTVNWWLSAYKRLQKITKHPILNPSESLLNIKYWNFEILQISSRKTMISAKKYSVAKIYLITQIDTMDYK